MLTVLLSVIRNWFANRLPAWSARNRARSVENQAAQARRYFSHSRSLERIGYPAFGIRLPAAGVRCFLVVFSVVSRCFQLF